METFRDLVHRYRWLGLALVLMAMASTLVISCGGGGGGSSDGKLCQQCGDTDGPCQDTTFIVPGANEPQPCPTPPVTEPACVERDLICRRKSDSSQQRCFPANESGSNVDFSFRCDGSRPGGTARPEPATPTPATPNAVATKTPFALAVCGDGVIQGTEVCDLSDVNGATCADFCNGDDDGTVLCTDVCQLTTRGCTGLNCTNR